MRIYQATEKDFSELVALGVLFWPKHTEGKIKKEFTRILSSGSEVSFICRDGDGNSIALMNASIRSDYVEGSNTSPVGYLEGVYVKEEYRKRGIAKDLLIGAEKWFASKGVSEIGSDAVIDNVISQKFHEKMGFQKGETIVHYLKNI
jgi:aminoglycoside 6'-N-acetyltransferase I